MLLLCLCQRRSSNIQRKRNGSQCDPNSIASASAVDYLTASQPATPQVHLHGRSNPTHEFASLPRSSRGGQRAVIMATSQQQQCIDSRGMLTIQQQQQQQQERYRTFQGHRRNSGTTTYVQVPRPDIDIRPASSMSNSTATFGHVRSSRPATKLAGQRSSINHTEDCFALEAIPAPPAQFNTDDDDSLRASIIAAENVALINSSPQQNSTGILRENGHATIMR
jgi:hypothetical protein